MQDDAVLHTSLSADSSYVCENYITFIFQETKEITALSYQLSNKGRNAYVIEHLNNALLKLLLKKPLNDIFISELVETALKST